jgi:oligopeptidase B
VTPRSVFDCDLRTRDRELLKQEEVVGGHDPSRYTQERCVARAPDGEEVPISLVYRADVALDGQAPLLLDGYGAYGHSAQPLFGSPRISLLDRGFIYAEAHIRGGEDLGRRWYDDGKLLRKRNTFTDFIACAEHLVQAGYTSSDRLIIRGASAGGLLVGAVTNLRPDLLGGAVAEVPFVDVLNTMLDPSLPLTVMEYEEWGNPEEREFFEYIRSYSPYDNVSAQDYPPLLITAGLNDPRVQFWEPAKLVARLRAVKTDSNPLLMKTEMGAGHGGRSGRYERFREVAFIYAWMCDTVGIHE